MNLVRNLEGFYKKGMKIFTRTENFKGTDQTEWTIADDIIDVASTNH